MHLATEERACRSQGLATRIVAAINHATSDDRSDRSQEDASAAAADALRSGMAVCLPTETVAGLAVLPESVDLLHEIKGTPSTQPFARAYGRAEDAMSVFSHVTPGMGRLAYTWLPGPLTIVGRSGDEWLGVRVPAHPAVLSLCRAVSGPVVLTSANLHGGPTAPTAREAAASLGDPRVHLFDAEGGAGHPSTVVQVAHGHLRILREGAVPAEDVRRVHGRRVLFVCTGNTCRSPMAAAAARELLAEILGVKPARLKSLGYSTISAGAGAEAGFGAPMSPGAAVALVAAGVSTGRHQSRQVTGDLLASVDHVVCMTQSHREHVAALAADCADGPDVLMLDPRGTDVPDPIGGGPDVYRACMERMTLAIKQLLPRLL